LSKRKDSAPPVEPWLGDAKWICAIANISEPTLWRGVKSGRYPLPLYPTPNNPKWIIEEFRQALLATRRMPADRFAAMGHNRPGRKSKAQKAAAEVAARAAETAEADAAD
jgi:hypothetical protein